MNRDLAREAFERWYNAEYVRPIIPADRTEGGYQHPDAQSAWDAWQAALSHAEGEPFAYCFTDVNGRPTEFTDGQPGAPEDLRIITPLFKHPAPQVAVPEGWREEFDQFWDAQTGGRNEWTTLERLAALDAWQHAIEWVVQHGRAPTAPAGEPKCGDTDGQLAPMTTEQVGERAREFGKRCRETLGAGQQLVSDPDGLAAAERPGALMEAAGLLKIARSKMGDDDDECESDEEATRWRRMAAVEQELRDLVKNSAPAPDEREIAARALEGMAKRLGGNRPKWASTACMKEVRRLRTGKEGEPS